MSAPDPEPHRNASPFEQLGSWLAEAAAFGIPEPEAATLATVSAQGRPSARMVLVRGIGGDDLRFFTNYRSRKALELESNPWAALLFFWAPLERQVRVEGPVERLPEADSDLYFASRPRESRLAAWASPQSEVLAGREVLMHAFEEAQRRFEGGEPPRPPFWGGYRLVPDRFEFWIGGAFRLHDRFLHLRTAAGWDVLRLAP